MKIAITGKGGVGKSTIAAAVALLLAARGKKVLAVDADPDANLAQALGMPAAERETIITIARHKELIEERTGTKIGSYGQMFKLNPSVAGIAETYAVTYRGLKLLVLGAIKGGGTGCACPENSLLRALVSDLVLRADDTLILDMEAGIEHLGRATARGVDLLITVVDPGQRALDTLKRIALLAAEIGISKIYPVLNGAKNQSEVDRLRAALGDYEILGLVPYSEQIRGNDREGSCVIDRLAPDVLSCLEAITDNIINKS